MFFQFSAGRAGTSADNVRYITRSPATEGRIDAIYKQHYISFGNDERNYKAEQRDLIEYARQKEEDEMRRPRRGGGETQTHYRAIASFEGKIETEKALAMAKEYLEKNFEKTRSLAVVHQDTKNTHVHFHIQARDIENKKLRFGKEGWRELDKGWERVLEREFGKERIDQWREMKKETVVYKRAIARGDKEKEKPYRVHYDSGLARREAENRNYGSYELHKTTTRRTDRGLDNGSTEREIIERGEESRKREVKEFSDKCDTAYNQINRTEQAAGGILREIEGLRDEIERDDREKERYLERER